MIIGGEQSYKEFKESFYGRVKDTRIFDWRDINLLKVVLDGLKVNYIKRGTIRKNELNNFILFILKYIVKVFRHWINISLLIHYRREIFSIPVSDIICIDADRVEMDNGEVKSKFFYRITNDFPSNNYALTTYLSGAYRKGVHNFNPFSIVDNAIFYTNPIRVIGLYYDIYRFYLKIKKTNIFDDAEMFNISIALLKFISEYVAWKIILQSVKPKKCLLICHYHKEGFIYAAKEMNVAIAELQHGQISQSDIFYVFPESITRDRDKMLFPDKIFVYGDYWKDVLSHGAEYGSGRTQVLGYYQFDGSIVAYDKLFQHKKNGRVILLMTQFYLSEYFIRYVEQNIHLLSKDDFFVVKLHPNDNIELYNTLLKYDNVIVTKEHFASYIYHADAVISAYSTTLFDALRYDKPTYSLDIKVCSDYIDEFVAIGVTKRLDDDEVPGINCELYNPAIANRFYNKYDSKVLKQFLQKEQKNEE